jgi:hypothetical protein
VVWFGMNVMRIEYFKAFIMHCKDSYFLENILSISLRNGIMKLFFKSYQIFNEIFNLKLKFLKNIPKTLIKVALVSVDTPSWNSSFEIAWNQIWTYKHAHNKMFL